MNRNTSFVVTALPLWLLVTACVAGCAGSANSNRAADDLTYGSNRTMDPGDITGAGTSGNISGITGFAVPTSRPSR